MSQNLKEQKAQLREEVHHGNAVYAFRNKTGPKKVVERHGVCGASQTR